MKDMRLTIFLILVVNPYCNSASELLTIARTFDFLSDIRQHLYTGCVSLLYVSEQPQEELLDTRAVTDISRRFSKLHIPIAVPLFVNNTLQVMQCQRNLPLYVILSNSNVTRTMLHKVSFEVFRSATWLLFLTDSTVEEFLSGINIPFDCLFLVAQTGSADTVDLTEVYRISASFPLSKSPYCTWTSEMKLKCPEPNILLRRNTLHGLDIKVIRPIKTNVEDDGHKNLKLFFEMVWIDIAKNLQLNYSAIQLTNDSQGQKTIDLWPGIVGEISNGVAHVAVEPFGMKRERAMVVDFTMPLFTFKISIFIKEPDSALAWGRFLAPFSRNLWYAVIITALGLSVCLSLIYQIGRNNGNAEAEGPELYSLYNSFMYITGIFFQQGHEVTPKSWSCRVVYWMAYVTAIVLLASYSGTLISFLTVKHNSLPFSDISGLLEDKSYHIGMMKSYSHIFSTSKETPMLLENSAQRLLQKVDRSKRNAPSTVLEGLHLVCTTKYALLVTASVIPPLIDEIPCGVVALPRFTFEIGISYIIAKDSPYRSIINWKINALRDGGILKRAFAPVDASKLSKLHDGLVKVGLSEIAPILILLGTGVALGSLALMVEFWMFRRTRRHHQQRRPEPT